MASGRARRARRPENAVYVSEPHLKAVAPQWELRDIYRGMFDFMVLQMIGLALLFFFPQIALWLPNLLFK